MPFKLNPFTGNFDYYEASSGIESVVAGNNIDVDNTDPANPVVAVETLTLADISDVTASASELNILDGATLTTTELNYVDGVTSNIQTQLDSKLSTQTYQTFIYNSSGSQSGNRFNDEQDCIDALQLQAGPKLLIVEQDETFTLDWPLDEVLLKGNNGLEYNAGGWTITFVEGSSITGNLWAGINGVRVLSTATTHSIWTPTTGFSWLTDTVANIHSTSVPFVSASGSGQNIIAIRNSGRFTKLSGGVENFEFTGGAWSQNVIVSLGDGATISDDVLKSTNAVIYIPIIGSTNQALANWPPSHTNLNIGFQMNLNLTNSLALLYTPTGSLTADNVQDAIDELETNKVDTVNASRVLNSSVTTVGNVGTGEDDLITYAIPANTLATNGDSVQIETVYTVVNNANQKRIKFYFGSAQIFDTTATGLAVGTAYTVKLDIRIFRDGSNTQRYSVDYTANGGILGTTYGTASQTDTSTITIKGTGETNAASDNDVTQKYLYVKYDPV